MGLEKWPDIPKTIDLTVWKPGIRFVAMDLIRDKDFYQLPDEIAEKAMAKSVKAQEIADAAIYRLMSGGAKA